MLKVKELTSYEVELPDEDIQSLSKACEVLRDIHTQMKSHNCNDLELGYEDCPDYLEEEEILNALTILHILVENELHKMY